MSVGTQATHDEAAGEVVNLQRMTLCAGNVELKTIRRHHITHGIYVGGHENGIFRNHLRIALRQ